MTDFSLPTLDYLRSVTLRHPGDCSLLGVTPDLSIYAEEIYGSDGWIAQHCLSPSGEFLESIDESEDNAGRQGASVTPLALPDVAVRSSSGWQTMWLNFAGPRHRGMRVLERIDDLVRPFSIQDRIHLSQHPALVMPPPMVLGLAESYVLAEMRTAIPGVYFVCRRLRIAHLVVPPGVDEMGEPFDYDTRVIYAAHFAARSAALDDSLIAQMQPLPGVSLMRPMDCVITGDHLLVADGGEGERVSAIHLWQLSYPVPILTAEEQRLKRIYG
ncbi:MAG: hypothetical protein L6Q98_18800 [Anaerolineae bacterium]|nr:hypothetical protein [Anaerolineae bacterium]NUQ03581.1 hypothetical protein [Anaerolineae bacterium]